jgi:hypothetical protein
LSRRVIKINYYERGLVSKLATKAECDQAIEIANERKADLVFEKTLSSKDLTDQDKAVLSAQVSLITVKA